MNTPKTELKKFKELIENIKTGILITHSPMGELNGRPMAITHVDLYGGLWFFTENFSNKVKEIAKNRQVYISFAHTPDNFYAFVSGIATMVEDKKKMEELWTPAMRDWFPGGLEQPGISLLKVEPQEVEYWEGSSSKIVILFKMLSAMFKGETYTDGQHGKLELKSIY